MYPLYLSSTLNVDRYKYKVLVEVNTLKEKPGQKSPCSIHRFMSANYMSRLHAWKVIALTHIGLHDSRSLFLYCT